MGLPRSSPLPVNDSQRKLKRRRSALDKHVWLLAEIQRTNRHRTQAVATEAAAIAAQRGQLAAWSVALRASILGRTNIDAGVLESWAANGVAAGGPRHMHAQADVGNGGVHEPEHTCMQDPTAAGGSSSTSGRSVSNHASADAKSAAVTCQSNSIGNSHHHEDATDTNVLRQTLKPNTTHPTGDTGAGEDKEEDDNIEAFLDRILQQAAGDGASGKSSGISTNGTAGITGASPAHVLALHQCGDVAGGARSSSRGRGSRSSCRARHSRPAWASASGDIASVPPDHRNAAPNPQDGIAVKQSSAQQQQQVVPSSAVENGRHSSSILPQHDSAGDDKDDGRGDDAAVLLAFAQALRLDDDLVGVLENNTSLSRVLEELLQEGPSDGFQPDGVSCVLAAQSGGSTRQPEAAPSGEPATHMHLAASVDDSVGDCSLDGAPVAESAISWRRRFAKAINAAVMAEAAAAVRVRASGGCSSAGSGAPSIGGTSSASSARRAEAIAARRAALLARISRLCSGSSSVKQHRGGGLAGVHGGGRSAVTDEEWNGSTRADDDSTDDVARLQASLRALDAGDALADAPELQRVHSQASVRGLLLRLQDAVRQATYGGRGSSLQSPPKL